MSICNSILRYVKFQTHGVSKILSYLVRKVHFYIVVGSLPSYYITVYPAIVGCNQSQQQSQQQGSTVALSPYISSERSDQQQGGGAVESVEADGPAVTESGTRLTDCFTTLVDTLSNNNPQLIEQVNTIIS